MTHVFIKGRHEISIPLVACFQNNDTIERFHHHGCMRQVPVLCAPENVQVSGGSDRLQGFNLGAKALHDQGE